MIRSVVPVILLALAACAGPRVTVTRTAAAPRPEPPPDWTVRACGARAAWDGLGAFETRSDGETNAIALPAIVDRPLEVAQLRTRDEGGASGLELVPMRCEGQRWSELAPIALADAPVHDADGWLPGTLHAEPLAFGQSHMAILVRAGAERREGGEIVESAGWIVLLVGDRASLRTALVRRADASSTIFLAPHEGGVAVVSIHRRNGRMEGRIEAAVDARGSDLAIPDALWAARVHGPTTLCDDASLRCVQLCRDVRLVVGWERREEVPPIDATYVWLGRGAVPTDLAPGPLAIAQPALELTDASCPW